MHRKASYLFVILFVAMAIVCVAAPAARADEVSHARVVRLSFVEGDVAYQRAGATWQRAMMNQPIQQDFSLRTDAGYAEVEFETGLVIRLAQHTQMDFTELSMIDGRKVTRLKLDEGTIITTANLSHNDELSVAAGNVDVTVPRNGRFRVDATESQNWVTVFHGKVEVASGQTTKEVESGKTLHADGASSALSVDASPEADAFDKWVTDRDKAEQTSQSNASQYVSQQNYSYNVADLYNYGLWYNMPGYGMVWQPYGMGAGWMPFGNGLWMMGDPGMGWMWTSYEPWGWLPYHYGGWVNLAGGGWYWVPQNLGTFHGATANFVNVGNQVGWTPAIAAPVNPGKVKAGPSGPVQVVFAGGASNGVIMAGQRGQLTPGSTLKMMQAPAGSFSQSAPAASTLAANGVTVTGRAPVRPVSTAIAASSQGTASANNGAPAKMNGPAGRPTAMAPRSAPMPVMRAPSTFARVGAGGANAGVTPVRTSGNSGSVMTGAAHGTAAPASTAGSASHAAPPSSSAGPIKH